MNIDIGISIDSTTQEHRDTFYLCTESGGHILDEEGNNLTF